MSINKEINDFCHLILKREHDLNNFFIVNKNQISDLSEKDILIISKKMQESFDDLLEGPCNHANILFFEELIDIADFLLKNKILDDNQTLSPNDYVTYGLYNHNFKFNCLFVRISAAIQNIIWFNVFLKKILSLNLSEQSFQSLSIYFILFYEQKIEFNKPTLLIKFTYFQQLLSKNCHPEKNPYYNQIKKISSKEFEKFETMIEKYNNLKNLELV